MTEEVKRCLLPLCLNRKLTDPLFVRENGEKVHSIRDAWDATIERAGLQGLVFHDLRRSGLRNLRRSNVSESVAMRISGHKTAVVFRRYDITSEEDIVEASQKLERGRIRLRRRSRPD